MLNTKLILSKILTEKITHVDSVSSSVDFFELGIMARLNRFFLRNDPFRDLLVKLSVNDK